MLLPHDIDVLVVESQATMRAQLRNMLTSIGIEAPQFAVSATMAMRRLRAQRFDLVLCEYNLGEGQDGQHLLEDLRQHRIIPRDTLFVMITAERNYERVTSACELAPDDYILKPLTAETLRVRLLRALEKRDAFLPAWQLMKIGDPVAAIDYCASPATSIRNTWSTSCACRPSCTPASARSPKPRRCIARSCRHAPSRGPRSA